MAEPKKILIVEDDPDTADMLRAYFEAQGYDITITAWGKEALEICQTSLPDLIIQDIRLPDIDGYKVVSELRQSLRTSRIPIIFLTEKKARKDKISGLKLGAVDYITKPFDMQELRLRVRNALRRAGQVSLVSPVTGLPGKQVTQERIAGILQDNRWVIVYVSIAELEPFSEVYGFVAGDDVLRAVGIIVSNVVNEFGASDDFVGHIGKSGFILITHKERAKDIQNKLVGRLDRTFNYFYPVKDLESGKMKAPMTAKMSVVHASSGPYSSVDQVIEAAARSAKPVAGTHTGSQ